MHWSCCRAMIGFRNGTSPLWRWSSARLEGGLRVMILIPPLFLSDHIEHCMYVSYIECIIVSMFWAHSPTSSSHVFCWVFIFDYKTCHIPLKYRCAMRKSYHIRSICRMYEHTFMYYIVYDIWCHVRYWQKGLN